MYEYCVVCTDRIFRVRSLQERGGAGLLVNSRPHYFDIGKKC